MIDDEDDEDILNKRTSLKSLLKNLFVVFMIVLGAMFIYLGVFPDQITNFMVGFMLICFGTTILQIPKQVSEPIRQTLTILTCKICNITKVRNFENGDFVFNKSKIDNCDNCHDQMEISQIYSVRLKKPTEPNKKQEKLKKSSEAKK